MDFILKNSLFEIIIIFLATINSIMLLIFSSKELNNKIQRNDNKTAANDTHHIFKTCIFVFWIILLSFVWVYLSFKCNLAHWFTFMYYLVFIILAIKIRKKNISEFSYENKMYFVQTSFIYCIFFTSQATEIYLNSFSSISHTAKEYMLILFLIIKVLFFFILSFS